EGPHGDAAHANFAGGGEGEVFVRQLVRVVGQGLQRGAGVRAPQAERGQRVGTVFDVDIEAAVVAQAFHPHQVAVAGVAAADDAIDRFVQPDDGQIGINAAIRGEEVRVH